LPAAQDMKKALRETQTLRAVYAGAGGPSSIFVPNLKQIAQIVQKLIRGSRN